MGNESSIRTLAIAPRAHNAGSPSPMTSHHRQAKEEKEKLSLNFDSLKQKHKKMSTAGSPPARCSRSALLRRRHSLLPPSLLLLLASAFCWKGAAAQIGCVSGNVYIQYSASTESFFEALSGERADFTAVRAPRIHAWMLLFPTTRRCRTPRPPSVHRSFFLFPFSPLPHSI